MDDLVRGLTGIEHEFLLLTYAEYEQAGGFWGFVDDPRVLLIDDDILWYMYDTLRWIPTSNAARRDPQMPTRLEPWWGLCMYGPTIIDNTGAQIAAPIFRAWAALFANGPAELILTGGWEIPEDQTEERGGYAQIKVTREYLVSRLETLAHYAEQVVQSDGELLILHHGP